MAHRRYARASRQERTANPSAPGLAVGVSVVPELRAVRVAGVCNRVEGCIVAVAVVVESNDLRAVVDPTSGDTASRVIDGQPAAIDAEAVQAGRDRHVQDWDL